MFWAGWPAKKEGWDWALGKAGRGAGYWGTNLTEKEG